MYRIKHSPGDDLGIKYVFFKVPMFPESADTPEQVCYSCSDNSTIVAGQVDPGWRFYSFFLISQAVFRAWGSCFPFA